jgi:hypothetical protein
MAGLIIKLLISGQIICNGGVKDFTDKKHAGDHFKSRGNHSDQRKINT